MVALPSFLLFVTLGINVTTNINTTADHRWHLFEVHVL